MKICMKTLSNQEYVLNTDYIDRAIRFYMMSGRPNISEEDIMLSVDTIRAHKILAIKEAEISAKKQEEELDALLADDYR